MEIHHTTVMGIALVPGTRANKRVSEVSELSHVRVQLKFQIRTYIYMCARTSSYMLMLGGT